MKKRARGRNPLQIHHASVHLQRRNLGRAILRHAPLDLRPDAKVQGIQIWREPRERDSLDVQRLLRGLRFATLEASGVVILQDLELPLVATTPAMRNNDEKWKTLGKAWQRMKEADSS